MGELDRPFLSIIIPAYNEELRLPPTLHRIAAFLRQQAYCSEILVVENGSVDGTSAAVEDFAQTAVVRDDNFQVQLLHSPQGKGQAVRRGMLAAQGDYRVICDADLAVPIEEVTKFLPPALDATLYDIAIASREGPGAVRNGEPGYRHVMGRIFNFLVRTLAVPGVQDTQCGFKCFNRAAAELLFSLQRIDGWGFDVEVLHIASIHGLRMVEIPVTWFYGENSKVRPLQNTLSMLTELLKIRMNGWRGYYAGKPSPPATTNFPAA
ncbi:MAG: glycosyltransferase family 2 protein [Chloroflexi bacterium]|nr:glycosyltransferase family 2 protein [Chloroflexota bacterium]